MAAPWQPLLDAWFGEPLAGAGSQPAAARIAAAQGSLWFGYRDAQDHEMAQRFGTQVEQALAGGLEDWAGQPEGWLALLLSLDQLPRMIHRGTPRAFAGDARAREVLEAGLANGLDRRLPPIARVFAYLVLEHAEDRAAQRRAVAAFTALSREQGDAEPFADYLDYAERHARVIERFGRFPHRNALLGRASSAEETQFLDQPGSRF
ncbi:DUF924 family protein [Pseudomonas mangiferae]|uniref:DUF924 domain-containing protein n=1 Tax=Pseudomonas mangiferae TaxID=2593654 RepID=A0A553GYV2_9PSED|nr:DUF924 family protein [Pseudomonas mangiferae]TRX74673.1 DUF924 domain-containing protein [Pseudomonas mangiferae]